MKFAPRVYATVLLVAYLPAAPAFARDVVPTGIGEYFLAADTPAPAPLPPRESAPEAADWAGRIARVQYEHGPYHPGLAETLLDAGSYLYARGDIEGAIGYWRRAVHLTRVNEGLYSPLQLPTLERLRDTYLRLGDYGAVDDVESYLLHLRRRDRAPGDPGYLQAILAWADWKRRLWLRAPTPGEPRPLVSLWRLLEQQERDGDEAPLDRARLERLVQAQLNVLYVVSSTDFGPDFEADLSLGRAAAGFPDSENANLDQARALRDSAYRRGRNRLEQLLSRMVEAGDGPGQARALKSLGDWLLWHDRAARARAAYRDSWAALAASPELRQAWFGAPVELPDSDALWHGMDTLAEYREHAVVRARFTVTGAGRVVDIETGALDAEREYDAQRLRRLLRKSRFRPRLEAGEAVATEGLEREYRVRPR